jgi:hypothetical protein
MRINQTHANDLALPYPLRVSVEVKWTEALTSRLEKENFEMCVIEYLVIRFLCYRFRFIHPRMEHDTTD